MVMRRKMLLVLGFGDGGAIRCCSRAGRTGRFTRAKHAPARCQTSTDSVGPRTCSETVAAGSGWVVHCELQNSHPSRPRRIAAVGRRAVNALLAGTHIPEAVVMGPRLSRDDRGKAMQSQSTIAHHTITLLPR